MPGAYGLDPTSPDEAVTRDVLLGKQAGERLPDALLVVVDASNLDNHLRFTLQLIDLGLPIVVALNAIGNGLLRLIGVRRQEVDGERYHTSEELEFIVQESQAGGMRRGESGRHLRGLFELGDLTAVEVAVPPFARVGIPVGTAALY